MNCQEAKKIDLLSYLNKKGFSTKKVRENNAWVTSVFRPNERTPSLKIDLVRNTWWDFGEGIGGTIIDLIMRLDNCTVKEALEKLSNDTFPFHKQPKIIKKKTTYSILKESKLKSDVLLYYLTERKINLQFAKEFCIQIRYSFNQKKAYDGIAFKNNVGGFEVRNKYFKGCFGKKEITTIINHSKTVSIFESWSDFLSYLTLKNKIPNEDFIILNSTALVKNTINLIQNYVIIKTFFDGDDAGNKATDFIKENVKIKVLDNRKYYSKFNDLNDYLINRKSEQV